MDDVITRIVEIERQCSADIEQAQLEYAKDLEAHKSILEERKTREFAQIIVAENNRLTQSIEEAKIQTEARSAAFRQASENLFRDQILNETIKKEYL